MLKGNGRSEGFSAWVRAFRKEAGDPYHGSPGSSDNTVSSTQQDSGRGPADFGWEVGLHGLHVVDNGQWVAGEDGPPGSADCGGESGLHGLHGEGDWHWAVDEGGPLRYAGAVGLSVASTSARIAGLLVAPGSAKPSLVIASPMIGFRPRTKKSPSDWLPQTRAEEIGSRMPETTPGMSTLQAGPDDCGATVDWGCTSAGPAPNGHESCDMGVAWVGGARTAVPSKAATGPAVGDREEEASGGVPSFVLPGAERTAESD